MIGECAIEINLKKKKIWETPEIFVEDLRKTAK
jgi:hypothetical protein